MSKLFLGIHIIVLCRPLIDLCINTIVNTHSMFFKHDRIINEHNVDLLALYSSCLAKTAL